MNKAQEKLGLVIGNLLAAVRKPRIRLGLLLFLCLLLLSFLAWRWFTQSRIHEAAAYQMELPKEIGKDELGQLSDGQKRLLDEMIARNLQAKRRWLTASAGPAVVVLTQNSQPIFPGTSQTGGTGGPSGATPTSLPTSPTPTSSPLTPTLPPPGPLFLERED